MVFLPTYHGSRNPNPTSTPRVVLLVWAAFLFGLVLYGAVIVSGVLAPKNGDRSQPFPINPVLLFGLLSVGSLASTQFIASRMPRDNSDPQGFLGQFQAQMIVRGAGREAIGVYSITGQLLGMSRISSLIFIGAAAFLIVLLLPSILAALDKYRQLAGIRPGA